MSKANDGFKPRSLTEIEQASRGMSKADREHKLAQDKLAALLRDFMRTKDPDAKARIQRMVIAARNAVRKTAEKAAKQPY